jgi:succinoglycan biosynthesis transport protein ExoP
VKAFQAELIQADSDGAGRTAQSLMDRLAELRNSVNLAAEKVEAFKREHRLQSSEGQLMSASFLTLLNNQVLEAQHQVVQAQSRYRELVDNRSAGINTDALQSPTMAALRTQYATAKQLYDAQSLVLGPAIPSSPPCTCRWRPLRPRLPRKPRGWSTAPKANSSRHQPIQHGPLDALQ